jgi:hypothetical protein
MMVVVWRFGGERKGGWMEDVWRAPCSVEGGRMGDEGWLLLSTRLSLSLSFLWRSRAVKCPSEVEQKLGSFPTKEMK